MGVLRTVAKGAFPLSRVGVAMWAWKNRSEIGEWAGYVSRSAPRIAAGNHEDVLVEGRLRARLTADSRTRGIDGLHVEVQDGVAILTGTVPPEAHDAALSIATDTSGVRRVRDELSELRGRRGRARA